MKRELPLDEAYKFGTEHHLQAEMAAIQNLKIDEWPVYESAIRKGFIVDLFIQKEIFDSFKDVHWPYGNTKDGQKRTTYYLDMKKWSTPDAKKLTNNPMNIDLHGGEGTFISGIIDFISRWK